MIPWITYEQFGAVGDGVHNDAPAIRAAHDYANAHGLPVRTRADAVYHLGTDADTAIIMTDTDWGTSRFIVDDSTVQPDTPVRTAPIFIISNGKDDVALPIQTLRKGQKKLDFAPGKDYYVVVYEDDIRRYIRRGLNQNDGSVQTDNFCVTADGDILQELLWDFPHVTGVSASEIPKETLHIHGGYFTTVANQAESRYTYYSRNIRIERSNTEISGIHHEVTGEGDHGAPYSGFISVSKCADLVVRDCFLSGHKIYNTIGAAGKPVSMGTYDISIGSACNILFKDCTQHNILDNTRWGLVGSNFCKYVTFDGCVFSRTDAHQGMYNYTVRNCILGHQGLNVIGFGLMLVENCELYGNSMISFRGDYGSTWTGTMEVRNVVWHPAGNRYPMTPVIFGCTNDGQHDFGYECSLPETITLENVVIDDKLTPAGYDGAFIFANFNPLCTAENRDTFTAPYAYNPPRKVILRNVGTASGKGLKRCVNPNLLGTTEFIQE